MRTKLMVLIGSVTGAFLIYCSQEAANRMTGADGGPVGDAGAQAPMGGCCAPSFVTLSEGNLTTSPMMPSAISGEIDLSRARTAVLYSRFGTACAFGLTFAPTPSGVSEVSASVRLELGTPIPVIGPRGFVTVFGDCGTVPFHLLGIN